MDNAQFPQAHQKNVVIPETPFNEAAMGRTYRGEDTLDDYEDPLESLDIFNKHDDDSLEALDNELGNLFDLTPGAGLYLLASLVNELTFAPVETTSGEILIQPLIMSIIAERCFHSTQLLDEIGMRYRYDHTVLTDKLLNFTLEPHWYAWLSPEHAFNSPQTRMLEENGKRATLKYLGGQFLVSVKTLSMRGAFLDKQSLPSLQDAIDICIRALSRYLWHKTRGGIKSLCRKQAHITQHSDSLQLMFGVYEFTVAELDMGLHTNKPRIPWLGKSIQIDYQGEQRVRYGTTKKTTPAQVATV